MNLIIAFAAYASCGIFLYMGMQDSNWIQLALAAVLMAVGRVYIKRYKQNQ